MLLSYPGFRGKEKRPSSLQDPFYNGSFGTKVENFCGATQIDDCSSARRRANTRLSLVTGEKPVELTEENSRSVHPPQSIRRGCFCRHPTIGDSLKKANPAYSSASSVFRLNLVQVYACQEEMSIPCAQKRGVKKRWAIGPPLLVSADIRIRNRREKRCRRR